MTKTNFITAKFIKLGRGGLWESDCINKGIIRLGFKNPHHQESLDGNYENIKEYFISKGKSNGEITKIINAIRYFYTSDDSVLWITFFNKCLYYAIANGPAILLDDESRYRNTEFGWKNTDSKGNTLSVDRISGGLLKIQMFRGTICNCNIRQLEYLKRKINSEDDQAILAAKNAHSVLHDKIAAVIQRLTWQDFETLIDLIFSTAGYRRIGIVGKTDKDIDLDLMLPVSEKRAFVQIKSSSNQNEFDEYVEIFKSLGIYNEMYYVIHSNTSNIENKTKLENVKLIEINKISELSINAGLTNWIIEKAY